MGQQGCWHKGMSGQGCHVMPGPKGRRAERRHRATRGARTAWHRAPTVGDHPRPVQHRAPPIGEHTDLCHIEPHPYATPHACAAPGTTRWRPHGPLSHRTPPVADTPGLCSTKHPSIHEVDIPRLKKPPTAKFFTFVIFFHTTAAATRTGWSTLNVPYEEIMPLRRRYYESVR